MPPTELLAAMGKYNEELVNSGLMLGGDGLHPSSKGKRVRFTAYVGDVRLLVIASVCASEGHVIEFLASASFCPTVALMRSRPGTEGPTGATRQLGWVFVEQDDAGVDLCGG